ncbi:MAG: hypothetical protein P3A28_05425 [Gemmatimonadota bacterium]|nr:hypothetical protein [Gemmatimonadota bacterium]
MRGRLGAYLTRYQLRDFLFLRAALPTGLVVFFIWMIVKTDGSRVDFATPQGQRFATQVFTSFAPVFINLAAFLGVTRLVTDDRSNGYFRFLFSKPVNIERFYAQQWALHGVAYIAIAGALTWWLELYTAPVPVREVMIVMGLSWVLIGGIGFALTAATNLDALLLVAVWVASSVMHSLKDAPNSPMWGWMQQLTRLMPPTHKLDYIKAELYAGNPMPTGHLAHVLAYGAIGFIAAVVLLRRTSLAR